MNVLFIEDDRMNRRVVRDMLVVAGATMSEAGDAPTGLAMIDRNEYQVILVDLRMPGMDGMEAIAHIRARPDAKARLPIIIITADTAGGLREKCMAGGADEVLFKPVSMDKLFDTMGQLMARDLQAGGLIT